jgi:hypothetical protein
VPDVPRQEVAIRARHEFFLKVTFRAKKRTFNRLTGAFYAKLNQEVPLVRPKPGSISQPEKAKDLTAKFVLAIF